MSAWARIESKSLAVLGRRCKASDRESSRHVEVDHRDDFIERHGRVFDEILGPAQSFFLGGEADEQNRPGPAGGRCDKREARSNMVEVPEALSSARDKRCRRSEMWPASQAQVIVMSADHDKIIGIGARARKNGATFFRWAVSDTISASRNSLAARICDCGLNDALI